MVQVHGLKEARAFVKKGKYEERVDAQGDKYYIQTEEFEVDSKAQVDGYRAELDASLDAKQMDTVINAMDSFMSIMKTGISIINFWHGFRPG